MIKTCVICNKEFNAKKLDQLCCSAECSTKRQRNIAAEYRKTHPDKFSEWIKKSKAKRKARESLKDIKRKITVREDDPKWIKDYAAADRLTQISMLSIALTDLRVELMTYGKLSTYWDTEKYDQWEKQVLHAKRKEQAYVKAKDTFKGKNQATSKTEP